jgi:hypothetical protein
MFMTMGPVAGGGRANAYLFLSRARARTREAVTGLEGISTPPVITMAVGPGRGRPPTRTPTILYPGHARAREATTESEGPPPLSP